MSLQQSEVYIPVGTTLSYPFEPELLGLLKVDSRYEKVPVLDFSAIDARQNEAQFGPRTYPQIWLLDYVLTRQGDEVTTKQIAETGYPQTGCNKDLLAPIVKNLGKMTDAGIAIEPSGGRTHRSYKLPIFSYVEITYLGNRQKELGWRRDTIQKSEYNGHNPTPQATDYDLPIFNSEKSTQWRQLAACADMPSDLFVSDNEIDINKAIGICLTCTVKPDCKQARQQTGSFGVWGGKYYPLP